MKDLFFLFVGCYKMEKHISDRHTGNVSSSGVRSFNQLLSENISLKLQIKGKCWEMY